MRRSVWSIQPCQPVVAEAAREVPGEERQRRGRRRAPRDGPRLARRPRAEERLAAGGRRHHLRPDHVGAEREEQVAVRDRRTTTGRRSSRRGKSPWPSPSSRRSRRSGRSRTSPGAQRAVLLRARRAAAPRPSAPSRASRRGWHWPSSSTSGQAVEHRVGGRRLLDGGRARTSRRRRADRVLHLEADGLDVGQRHERSPQAEEIAGAGPVADRRHVVAGGRRLADSSVTGIAARSHDAGVRVEEQAARPLGSRRAAAREDAEVDPLRRGGAHLQHERLVAGPVAREVGRDVGEREARLARLARRVERDRQRERGLRGGAAGEGEARTAGGAVSGEDREEDDEDRAARRHWAPPESGATLRRRLRPVNPDRAGGGAGGQQTSLLQF